MDNNEFAQKMKTNKIIYWVATGLLCAMMTLNVGMYLFNFAEVSAEFSKLGFPTYLIYPLALAKALAVIAILTKYSKSLKEWAYAGLFFDFLLAVMAHLHIGDGDHIGGLVAMSLLFTSYFMESKAFSSH